MRPQSLARAALPRAFASLAGPMAGQAMPRVIARLAGLMAGLVVVLAVGFVAPAPANADPVRDEQWQLDALHADAAWRYADGAGVTVAVLDSGVDAGHVDLLGQVERGADFVDGSTDGTRDFVGHGTAVAAEIAGLADGAGVVGLAPRARILPVRVLDSRNRYDDASIVAGALRWAVDHGATVVNMSLGGDGYSPALADALGYAAAHDVVVVACTGNVTPDAAPTGVWYPARQPGVVAVAGLELPAPAVPTSPGVQPAPDGPYAGTGGGGEHLWSGSLTGPQTVLTAPATDLLAARPGGYWRVQGTSFAAPLVAATAALIRSRWPTMDAANVVNRLITTARDLGAPGRDDRYGYGAVDAAAAVSADVTAVTHNPLNAPAAPDGRDRAAAEERTPSAAASAARSPSPMPGVHEQARSVSGGADGSGTPVTSPRLANTAERNMRREVALSVGAAVVLLLLALYGSLALRRR